MAKLMNVIVQRNEEYWRVWADEDCAEAIKAIEGVTSLSRSYASGCFYLRPDPRYDADTIEHAIVEACNPKEAS